MVNQIMPHSQVITYITWFKNLSDCRISSILHMYRLCCQAFKQINSWNIRSSNSISV